MWRVCNSALHFLFSHGLVLFCAPLPRTRAFIVKLLSGFSGMFHRRVFTAALLLGVVFISPSVAQDASRVDQLEQQVRELTGQVEELTFQVKQMRKQSAAIGTPEAAPVQQAEAPEAMPQKKILSLDQNAVNDGGIEIVGGLSKPDDVQTSIYGDETQAQSGDGEQALALAPAPSGLARKKQMQPGEFEGVMVDQGGEPVAPSAAIADNGVSSEGIEQVALTEETPESLYKKSDEALLRRQFDIASNGFRKFLQTYPDHSLAGSAQYWLGESYFSQGDFRTAAQNYLSGYQKYPKSRRAPDSLLKLGMALNKLGQKDQGCAALTNVGTEYPKAVEAKKRAQVEFRRAGC
jgi:tol-pal system protein YbgF